MGAVHSQFGTWPDAPVLYNPAPTIKLLRPFSFWDCFAVVTERAAGSRKSLKKLRLVRHKLRRPPDRWPSHSTVLSVAALALTIGNVFWLQRSLSIRVKRPG
jgi:hypothetical protein